MYRYVGAASPGVYTIYIKVSIQESLSGHIWCVSVFSGANEAAFLLRSIAAKCPGMQRVACK